MKEVTSRDEVQATRAAALDAGLERLDEDTKNRVAHVENALKVIAETVTQKLEYRTSQLEGDLAQRVAEELQSQGWNVKIEPVMVGGRKVMGMPASPSPMVAKSSYTGKPVEYVTLFVEP